MKSLKLVFCGLLLFTGISYLSCNSSGNRNSGYSDSGNNSMDSANNLNETKFGRQTTKQQNAQYLMKIYASGLYEIRASKEALKRSDNIDVKDLAKDLIDGYTKLNDKIEKLADQKQISIPGSLTGEQNQQLDRLMQEKATPFDEDYLRQMVNDHKDAINLLNEARQSNDKRIISWANETLPEIQQHLEKVTTCQNAIDSLQK